MARAHESTDTNLQLMDVTLELENSRAYWAHVDPSGQTAADQVFSEFWFGSRSLPRSRVLLRAMRARFDAFPSALAVLHQWSTMGPETRRCICHWHLQLADPLYRHFTGEYLVERRRGARPEVSRDLALAWMTVQGSERWTTATRIQLASKLLSTCRGAGLVETIRDPRPLTLPRVPNDALGYILHLLREVQFEGTLLANPYLTSVGLVGSSLEDRLRTLPELDFRRQGELVEFGWQCTDLAAWAAARIGHASRSAEESR